MWRSIPWLVFSIIIMTFAGCNKEPTPHRSEPDRKKKVVQIPNKPVKKQPLDKESQKKAKPPPKPSWQAYSITQISTGSGERFHKVAFPTREAGYAASNRAMYKTMDGGQTWRVCNSSYRGRVHFLTFDDAKQGWMGRDQLYRTIDGGKTWNVVVLDADALQRKTNQITAFAKYASDWSLTGGKDLADNICLCRQQRDGEWEKLDPATSGYWGEKNVYQNWHLQDLSITSPKRAYAVLSDPSAQRSVVLETKDTGATWSVLFQPKTPVFQISFINEQQGWLLGDGGMLWQTEDGGKSWQPLTLAAEQPEQLRCFAISAGKRTIGIAPLYKDEAYLTVDGKNWKKIDLQLGVIRDATTVDGGCMVLSRSGRIAVYGIHSTDAE